MPHFFSEQPSESGYSTSTMPIRIIKPRDSCHPPLTSTQKKELIQCSRPNDVLIGPGTSFKDHPGNLYFRAFVDQHVSRSPNVVHDREFISRSVSLAMNLINEQYPPGRFLREDKASGMWYDANENAIKWVKECVRRALKKKKIMETNCKKKLSRRVSFSEFVVAVTAADGATTTSIQPMKMNCAGNSRPKRISRVPVDRVFDQIHDKPNKSSNEHCRPNQIDSAIISLNTRMLAQQERRSRQLDSMRRVFGDSSANSIIIIPQLKHDLLTAQVRHHSLSPNLPPKKRLSADSCHPQGTSTHSVSIGEQRHMVSVIRKVSS